MKCWQPVKTVAHLDTHCCQHSVPLHVCAVPPPTACRMLIPAFNLPAPPSRMLLTLCCWTTPSHPLWLLSSGGAMCTPQSPSSSSSSSLAMLWVQVLAHTYDGQQLLTLCRVLAQAGTTDSFAVGEELPKHDGMHPGWLLTLTPRPDPTQPALPCCTDPRLQW
jgi:hypothetical protein